MYEKIKKILENKVSSMSLIEEKMSNDEKELFYRLKKVKELFDSEYDNFFNMIKIDTAYSILRDIGIEEEINNVYLLLMKEKINTKRYILVDPNNINI